MLDYRYKMNRHGMLLLDMIRVDVCERSSYIVFIFILGESEDDYS